MLGATIYTFALACLLLGSLIAALIDDAAHDPFGDRADGDWPFITADDLEILHANSIIRGEQRCGE